MLFSILTPVQLLLYYTPKERELATLGFASSLSLVLRPYQDLSPFLQEEGGKNQGNNTHELD